MENDKQELAQEDKLQEDKTQEDKSQASETTPAVDEARQEILSNRYLAATAILLGLIAIIAPLRIFDIIAGVAGISCAIKAMKPGSRALAVIGLLVALLGTIVAVLFTANEFGIFHAAWITNLF